MTTAIIMAAGLGSRMRPLTDTTAKPLIKVHGVPMIETVLKGIYEAGVERIFVVVGYHGEQFLPLEQEFPGLTVVKNTEYETKNNISSIHAVCDHLGEADTFICEADLYVKDSGIFAAHPNRSCYYGVMVPGHSDDWVFEQDEAGRITRVGKGGDDCYNMCGVAFLRKDDAVTLRDAILSAYEHPGHEDLFWDDIVDRNLDRLDLTVHPIRREQIIELDTVAELAAEDPSYSDAV